MFVFEYIIPISHIIKLVSRGNPLVVNTLTRVNMNTDKAKYWLKSTDLIPLAIQIRASEFS